MAEAFHSVAHTERSNTLSEVFDLSWLLGVLTLLSSRGEARKMMKRKKKKRFAFFLQFLLVFAFDGTEVVVQLTPSAGDFAFATPCPTAAEFSGDPHSLCSSPGPE